MIQEGWPLVWAVSITVVVSLLFLQDAKANNTNSRVKLDLVSMELGLGSKIIEKRCVKQTQIKRHFERSEAE